MNESDALDLDIMLDLVNPSKVYACGSRKSCGRVLGLQTNRIELYIDFILLEDRNILGGMNDSKKLLVRLVGGPSSCVSIRARLGSKNIGIVKIKQSHDKGGLTYVCPGKDKIRCPAGRPPNVGPRWIQPRGHCEY